MNLILRKLNKNDKNSFFIGIKDWDEKIAYDLYSWQEQLSYNEILNKFNNESNGIGLSLNEVPDTTLFAFIDTTIVGRLNIRHYLNDGLTKYGGHIGYIVAKKYRNNGYATEMLKQALTVCKELHINEVLLSCDDVNAPSIKVIEKCGGKLSDIIWDESLKRNTRRYWILNN